MVTRDSKNKRMVSFTMRQESVDIAQKVADEMFEGNRSMALGWILDIYDKNKHDLKSHQ